jgi:hypothetical protein
MEIQISGPPVGYMSLYDLFSVSNWVWKSLMQPIAIYSIYDLMSITVAARSKAWNVFGRSNAGIMGSNPTEGMDVCVRLFCACVVLCVAALRRADTPSKIKALQTV